MKIWPHPLQRSTRAMWNGVSDRWMPPRAVFMVCLWLLESMWWVPWSSAQWFWYYWSATLAPSIGWHSFCGWWHSVGCLWIKKWLWRSHFRFSFEIWRSVEVTTPVLLLLYHFPICACQPLHIAIQTQGSHGLHRRPSMRCQRGENAVECFAGHWGGEVVAEAWKPHSSFRINLII